MQLKWFDYYNLLIFEELDSTNLEARRLVQAGVAGNFVIWAERQTHGKGRQGRTWISLPDNLYVSIILDSSAFSDRQAEMCFVTGLAVYDAVQAASLHKLDMALKWPNDLMIGSSKVSGILLESIKIDNRHHLIIGIGINIANHPSDLEKPATSMRNTGIQDVDVGKMLDLTMSSFEYYRSLWMRKGFDLIRESWLQKVYNPSEIMTVSDGTVKISGVFQDIDSHGAIRLKSSSGMVYTLSTGEVLF